MACGGTISGPIVARGHIPGQRWDQRACRVGRREIEVDFDFPQPGGYDEGGEMEVLRPSARWALFIGAPAEGWGTTHESAIEGVTFGTITRVRLTFADGFRLNVNTRPAPAKLRRRFTYLRHVRFYTARFARNRGVPNRVCGFGVHGHLGPCFVTSPIRGVRRSGAGSRESHAAIAPRGLG